MKKISFRVRNFDKEQFLTFNIDNDATLDEEVLDFIENEEPKGVVPVIFEEGEEFDTFSYDITDKIHICELSNQEINAEMVLRVLRSIVLALIDMSEYRIPLSYLVLNRNYIYVDSEYQIEFVCVPLEDMQEEADVNTFLRNLLASLRFEPSENGDYVAKLFTYINNEAMFNLRNMVALVEELMDEMNVEIPENDSAEIYADYQEVLDVAEELEEEEPLLDQDLEQNNIEEPEEAAVEEEEYVVEEPAEEPVIQEPIGELKAQELDEEESTDEDIEEAVEEPAEESEELAESEGASEETIEEENPEDSDAAILTQEPDTSQEIVNKLKERLARNKKSQDAETDEGDDSGEAGEDKKGGKRPAFKTKDTSVTGVVIQDELDEFLAEKEMEEQLEHHEESNLKIKKNIKVSRASIVKNTQEELKAAEEAMEGEDEVTDTDNGEDEASQAASTAAPANNTEVPKVNPYLIRVNTNERVMITKQNFKIGKTGMGVDYTVTGNSAVSRVHAIITNQDGDYYIKDNKSTNHTYVNGKIVNEGENALLTDGCKIVLGDEEFTFKLG